MRGVITPGRVVGRLSPNRFLFPVPLLAQQGTWRERRDLSDDTVVTQKRAAAFRNRPSEPLPVSVAAATATATITTTAAAATTATSTAAATATASAVAATASATTTTATASAAAEATTGCAWTRFIHRQRTAVQRCTVHLRHCAVRQFVIRQLDERKAAWLAGVAISNDVDCFNRTIALECRPQSVVGCVERQISNVQVLHGVASVWAV
jgi:hypothetical protein